MKRLSLQWLNNFGNERSRKTALISKRKISFAELNEKIENKIFAFARLGITKGSRVALIQKNGAAFIENVIALWKLGATPTPINFRLPVEEIEQQIKFIDPLLTISEFSEISKKLQSRGFTVRNKIRSGDYDKNNVSFHKNRLTDTALLMFTSGSASEPKCVELTFKNLIYSARNVNNLIDASNKSIWLASLPFYHIGGFSIIIRALISGSTIILPDALSAASIAESVKKYSPDFLSLVPTTLKIILADKGNIFRKVKTVFLGGSAIGDELVADVVKLKLPVIIVYGSTETSSMVTAAMFDDYKRFPRAAGKPIGENRILILGKKGKLLSRGKTGDVVVSSAAAAKGYFNNRELTKLFFASGGYLTNDVGYVNKEGLLFIKRRKDNVIISGGENIDLDALKKETLKLKSVSEVYLFGLPDKKWGTALTAAIVSDDEEKCKFEISKKFKGIKKPKKVYFVKELPKSELGKVIKSELLKMLNL